MDQSKDKIVNMPGTLASNAYQVLRHEVVTASLLPGEKLNISRLCEKYEIGLSPMREALNRLSRDGLVTQMDRQGFRVAPIGVEQLEQITRTRCWLNEIGLRESIIHGDDAWEEGVVLAAHRLSRATRNSDVSGPDRGEEWNSAHRAYHESLICACRSAQLIEYCDQLFDAAERYRHISRIVRPTTGPSNEHKEIMEAAVARDAELAPRLLVEHMKHTTDHVMTWLKEAEADIDGDGQMKRSGKT